MNYLKKVETVYRLSAFNGFTRLPVEDHPREHSILTGSTRQPENVIIYLNHSQTETYLFFKGTYISSGNPTI